MANLWTANFDVSPDNTTLTSGNTGLSNIYNSVSDSGETPYQGTFSALMALAASNATAGQDFTSRDVVYYGAAFKFGGAVSATTAILQTNATSTIRAAIRIFTDMTLQMRNGTVEVWASADTHPSFVVATGTGNDRWYWIEHYINNTLSQQRCRVYDSTGALVVDSGNQTYDKGSFDRCAAGVVSNNTVTLHIDRFMGDGSTLIGPISVPQNYSITVNEAAGGAESFGRTTNRPVTETSTLDEGYEVLDVLDTYDESAGCTDTVILAQTHSRVVTENAGCTDTPDDDLIQGGFVDIFPATIERSASVLTPRVNFVIKHDFEGANGADIGLTDLGFDGGDNDGGTTKFDTSWFRTGTSSLRFNILSSGNWHNRYYDFGSAPTGQWQCYFRTSVSPPTATTGIVRFGADDGTKAAGIQITSAGKFRIQDNTLNSSVSTVTVAANTTYRLRYQWDFPNNLAYLHIYYGANLEGMTPDETITYTIGLGSTLTTMSRVQIGAYLTVGTTAPAWNFDAETLTTFGDPGPEITNATVLVPETIRAIAAVGEAEGIIPRPYAVSTLTLVMG